MPKPTRKPAPEICPVCGEDVPPKALACPECGADHESGWKEGAEIESFDPTDDEFDYDSFVEKEFGGDRSPKPHDIKWIWWITAIAVVAVFLYSVVRSLF
ncbi:MAG TPA: zinc ribbon domain-containing protein [Chthoniobacteraceae bacterium]